MRFPRPLRDFIWLGIGALLIAPEGVRAFIGCGVLMAWGVFVAWEARKHG